MGGHKGKLFKTVDGGNNWFQLQISNSQDAFESIWFNSPDTGFVVSFYGKLFRTTDGGGSWISTDLVGSFVSFYDSENGIITGESGIHRTFDGGITWNTVEFEAPIYECAYASANIILLGGDYMRRSVDGGVTWDIVAGAPRGIRTFCFVDELIGYAVAGGQIYKTADGGITWTLQSQNNTENLFSINFIGETGYISGAGTFRPSLYKTTNGGNNWLNLASGKGITCLTDLDIADDGCVLMKTSDGGGVPVAVKDIPLMTVKLNVFPNPVCDVITVESMPNSNLSVYNITGKLMYNQRSDGRITKLDLSRLPNGIYIIRQLGDSTVATSKVIKK